MIRVYPNMPYGVRGDVNSNSCMCSDCIIDTDLTNVHSGYRVGFRLDPMTHLLNWLRLRLRSACRRPACSGGKKQRSNMHCRCFLGQASSWKWPLRLALTEFKHINKHVFVRMWKKFTPASGSSTLPRRT
jgi:hypothetical protein